VSDRPPVLLAVFAHPDDESFRCGGTLALLARRGIQVHSLTATRGEAGSCGEPPVCRAEELGVVREQELRCACAALGIAPPIFLDYFDGKLAEVNEKNAVTRIIKEIQKLRPQVLLTWPSDGLSGHPDHIAVSCWTKQAYEEIVKNTEAPLALYHLAIPHSVANALSLAKLYSIPDEDISLTVDVAEVWEQKLAAIRCHRTQTGDSPILAAREEKQRLFLGKEYFTCALANEDYDFLQSLIGKNV